MSIAKTRRSRKLSGGSEGGVTGVREHAGGSEGEGGRGWRAVATNGPHEAEVCMPSDEGDTDAMPSTPLGLRHSE